MIRSTFPEGRLGINHMKLHETAHWPSSVFWGPHGHLSCSHSLAMSLY